MGLGRWCAVVCDWVGEWWGLRGGRGRQRWYGTVD